MGFWKACGRRSCVHVGGVLAFFFASASAAQTVSVSLPTDAVIKAVGGTTSVPMNIGAVSGLAGVAVSFTFNQTIANIAAISDVQLGTVVSTCSAPTVNLTQAGRVTITLACTTPVNSPTGGSLFMITFTGVGNGMTPLTFSAVPNVSNGCLLNEGSPTCEPSNGQITVGSVQPTVTVTTTASATATATVGLTATSTATATVGLTATGSATATTASTATATATSTSVPTVTNTPTTGPSSTPTQTLTPSGTPSVTQTTTPSSTVPPSQTPSVTQTASVTQTPSVTLTPSDTPTVTATGTVTNTPPPTNTRAGIPVVPSPTSPAGLLMVIGLGVSMVWALRRLQRPQ